MIEAVDVHTTGLGGDSHVRLDREGRLVIGPRRAVPLSLLASEHPEVLAELRGRAATPRTRRDEEVADFIVSGRQPGSRLDEAERDVLEELARGPRSVAQVAGGSGSAPWCAAASRRWNGGAWCVAPASPRPTRCTCWAASGIGTSRLPGWARSCSPSKRD